MSGSLRVAGLCAVAGVLAGCGVDDGDTQPGPAAPPSTSESAPESVTPSLTRQVPPQQRTNLAGAPPQALCGLISADDLGKLAFPVKPEGRASEVGFDPPAKGCTFDADSGPRSVMLAAQPAGYADLGAEDVGLGADPPVPATMNRHLDDCTVFAGVAGATLQVVVGAPQADSDECEQAQSIAQYAVSGLTH